MSKTIPQLDVGTLGLNSLFETAQVNSGSATGYDSTKVSASDVGTFVATQQNYSGLQTTAKTLVGAINEAAQGGGGSSTLAGLSDVQFGTLYNGQTIYYDSVAQKWKNKNGDTSLVVLEDDSSHVLDGDISDLIPTSDDKKNIILYDFSNEVVYQFAGYDDMTGEMTFVRQWTYTANNQTDYYIGYAIVKDSTSNPGTEMTVTYDQYKCPSNTFDIPLIFDQGESSKTVSDNRIYDTMLVNLYANEYGIVPASVSVSTGSITVTLSEARQSLLIMKARFSW